MTSVTFAAVICDADEPCSVKTACAPESSFTMSPRSATRPGYFWYFGSNSKFWDDRCPSVWQSGLSFSLCASTEWASLLLLTLSNCRAGNFSSLACSVLQPLWASRCSHLATHSRLHGNFLTINVVEDVSKKKKGIYTYIWTFWLWEFWVIWDHLPSLPRCMLIWRQLLVHHSLVVLHLRRRWALFSFGFCRNVGYWRLLLAHPTDGDKCSTSEDTQDSSPKLIFRVLKVASKI